MRSMKQRYEDAMTKIGLQRARIKRLEEDIERLEDRVEELEDQIENEDLYAEEEEVFEGDEDFLDPYPLWEFIEDIGFDPENLPSSLGERMEIRDRLQKVY